MGNDTIVKIILLKALQAFTASDCSFQRLHQIIRHIRSSFYMFSAGSVFAAMSHERQFFVVVWNLFLW